MTTTWDPAQYLGFADQRLRPALELLAHIPLPEPSRIVDLGCGAGNVTRRLRRRWPQAEIVALDSSAEMLAKARTAASSIRWVKADLATWEPTIRLFVVSLSPPESSRVMPVSSSIKTAPHPPGPGFGLAPPSV